jgi:hypothetical protein
MSEYSPGDIVTVLVDGLPCETIIDKDGVQRFRQNGALCWFVETATAGYRADMDELAFACHLGVFSKEDYAEIYRLLGYPVSDFREIFEDAEIENPIWGKGNE